jgi:phosphoribosylformylglycinamidine cyclo-ligase
MHRVFNCGIGMVLVVARSDAKTALEHLNGAGEQAWLAGEIVPRAADAPAAVVR